MAMVLGLAASLGVSLTTSAAGQINVYAAGSLRGPLTEAAQAYEQASGVKVVLVFGASGLLKERIEKGESADVFASANTEHPQALADSGRMATPVTFTRNQMCALAAPAIAVTSETLLDRMLQNSVKLGTSTPKADPSGDYAWKVFEKAERVSPGAFASLSAKALKLTGGPDSPPPPKDRSGYGELVATGKADIFLLYCTSAVQAVKDQTQLRQIALPRSLAVWADYGVAIAKNANPGAQGFVDYLVSDAGQKSFARFGFARVAGSRLTIQLPSGQTREISHADIQKLEPFKVSAKAHGKSHEWQGTKLLTLLESADIKFEKPSGGGASVRQYLILEGDDGYKVVFAMGELDPIMTTSPPMVAWLQDGKPLSADEAPLRLIVAGDPRGARQVRKISRITVGQID
jgi:ABC-type molybdate transport system substrate-binding protein